MSRAHSFIRGVYAITPDERITASLASRVSEALAGGVRLLQYRNKLADKFVLREQASALRKLTHDAGAQLIINDDIELALAVSADGVHLGRDDRRAGGALVDIGLIRQRAAQTGRHRGPFFVGISCYNEVDAARDAVAAGADYIAFGSFYPSPTKPSATHAELALIRNAKREFSLPVVAIGGITLENAPQLIVAGADAIAVISSLFHTDNVRSRAQFFSSLFSDHVQEQPKII
jgi:thiamine-phosphate pyrophosphorylase